MAYTRPFLTHNQGWAKFIIPIQNFPTTYDRNQNLKILIDHFPMRVICQPKHIEKNKLAHAKKIVQDEVAT